MIVPGLSDWMSERDTFSNGPEIHFFLTASSDLHPFLTERNIRSLQPVWHPICLRMEPTYIFPSHDDLGIMISCRRFSPTLAFELYRGLLDSAIWNRRRSDLL